MKPVTPRNTDTLAAAIEKARAIAVDDARGQGGRFVRAGGVGGSWSNQSEDGDHEGENRKEGDRLYR